ncbi:MAG: ABC transporter ATP-binding protein, partial [Anaerolineales bacterium]
MLLELDNVTHGFEGPQGKFTVLRGAELSLSAGDFVAIQGASGSGKSTLLLIAGALLTPDEGRVLIDGENASEMSAEQRGRLRAEKLGFVFQQFHLIPYLSVLDNVMAPSLALPRDGQQVRQRAAELLEHFQLTNRADHLAFGLSAGESQRVALARALLNEPKLILADEPTGNLDPLNSDIVLNAMSEFAQQSGAVLLVTHDRDAAAAAD